MLPSCSAARRPPCQARAAPLVRTPAAAAAARRLRVRASGASPSAFDSKVREVLQQDGCLKAAAMVEAAQLLEQPVDGETVQLVFESSCREGEWKAAYTLLEELRNTGTELQGKLLLLAATASIEHGQWEAGESMLEQILDSHDDDDAAGERKQVAEGCIRAMARAGRFDAAVELVEVLRRRHTPATHSTYSTLAAYLMKSGDCERAEEMLEERDYLSE